jgi:hypothetical protein
MLKIDLDNADHLVEQAIRSKCVEVGQVISVTIHRSPVAFAIVKMHKWDETHALTSRFGGTIFGSHVLIHLEQTESPETFQTKTVDPRLSVRFNLN